METTTPFGQTQTDLLDGLDSNIVQASRGQRFVNVLIDLVAYYTIMIVLGTFLQPFVYIIITPLLSPLCFALFLSFQELLFKGRTIGKFATGTRSVQEDGTTITAGQAFGRGFSRIVPFEAFSALGDPSYPWHDRWTRTYVADIRDSTLPEA